MSRGDREDWRLMITGKLIVPPLARGGDEVTGPLTSYQAGLSLPNTRAASSGGTSSRRHAGA